MSIKDDWGIDDAGGSGVIIDLRRDLAAKDAEIARLRGTCNSVAISLGLAIGPLLPSQAKLSRNELVAIMGRILDEIQAALATPADAKETT